MGKIADTILRSCGGIAFSTENRRRSGVEVPAQVKSRFVL